MEIAPKRRCLQRTMVRNGSLVLCVLRVAVLCILLCFSPSPFRCSILYFGYICFSTTVGHGQGGELVSQFALHEVQRRLERHPDFTNDIEKAFKETFLAVDEALNHDVFIEPLYAGTTACVALLRENNLIVSNVGDSRAVMARKTQTNDEATATATWQAIDLSKDQNPDMPEEQSRIESMGGFVSPPPEPGLSARVWLDVGCTQIGLAMSRSLGDHAVKQVGVIAEPVVTQHEVTEEDDFVILATDGVWEFISSEEAVGIVSENLHRGATKACQTLIEAAAAKWHDEEGDYRDDITALVIRLQHLWSSPSTTTALPKSPQKTAAPAL
jgi:protein phosphatase 2C family protein 2/3